MEPPLLDSSRSSFSHQVILLWQLRQFSDSRVLMKEIIFCLIDALACTLLSFPWCRDQQEERRLLEPNIFLQPSFCTNLSSDLCEIYKFVPVSCRWIFTLSVPFVLKRMTRSTPSSGAWTSLSRARPSLSPAISAKSSDIFAVMNGANLCSMGPFNLRVFPLPSCAQKPTCDAPSSGAWPLSSPSQPSSILPSTQNLATSSLS